ncbi:MAG: glycosyltransferase [Ferruginibacter sp.]
MPCYNCGQNVSFAIESILKQSFVNFEFIIVNDGSSDSTDLQIKKYSDKRIKYIAFNKIRGHYTAGNEGLKIAKGKYICLMDAEAIAETDRLATQFNYMESHPKVGCLGSSGKVISGKGDIARLATNQLDYSQIKIYLLKNNYTVLSSLILRKSLLKKNNLFSNEKISQTADYDFIARCSKKFPIVNIDKDLIWYRTPPYQIASTSEYEQKQFTDGVRLWLLEGFNVKLSLKEMDLYLRLMREDFLPENLIEKGIVVLDKLLQSNDGLKLYNRSQLFTFFEWIVALALQKKQLGGWAIEKKLIDFIAQKIPSGKSILEFGSGAGTDVLLENYKVISIEHDKGFLHKRNENHTSIHAPIQNKWYHRNKVKLALNKQYDMLLIDGPPGELRNGILDNLDLFQKNDKPVIFDDINRDLDKAILISFCNALNYQYQIFMGDQKTFAYCTINT